jgi:hypothetical protein
LSGSARRFDGSLNWVSRRLALVELLPEAIQQHVREGKIAAQRAMMAAAFVQYHCDTRPAGQLYAAWRDGWRVVRERILAEPELVLKTQRQPPSARPAVAGLERELEMAVAIPHRAGRRLAAARPEMDGPRQEHAQRQIESAPGTGPDGGAHRKGTGSPTC